MQVLIFIVTFVTMIGLTLFTIFVVNYNDYPS
jgi:hypothetical protein